MYLPTGREANVCALPHTNKYAVYVMKITASWFDFKDAIKILFIELCKVRLKFK